MTAIFDALLPFDLSVFEWIQGIQNNFLTAIMTTITTLGDDGIIFIIMGIVLLCTKKYRKVGLTVLLALLVMLICNNLILKELFARVRPFNLDAVEYDWWYEVYRYPNFNIHKPSSFSFPSGHTSSAFAAAIAVLWYNRKGGIPLTIFAAIMGFTRIYVQVHYCTDVLAGAFVGAVYALLAVLIAKYLFPVIDKVFDTVFSKFKKKEA